MLLMASYDTKNDDKHKQYQTDLCAALWSHALSCCTIWSVFCTSGSLSIC